MQKITEENIHHLNIFFRYTNIYWWRYRRETESPKEYRYKRCSYWNRSCQKLVELNLAIERVIDNHRCFSPTVESLKILSDSTLSSSAFDEIRLSFINAPDKQTRQIIAEKWKIFYMITEQKEFPIYYCFDYLLSP